MSREMLERVEKGESFPMIRHHCVRHGHDWHSVSQEGAFNALASEGLSLLDAYDNLVRENAELRAKLSA